MARTPEKTITDPFVEELMDLLECNGSYKEAERKTGITEGTWRAWADGKGNLKKMLEYAHSIETKSGTNLQALVKKARKHAGN